METRTIARTDGPDLTVWTIEVRDSGLIGPQAVTLVSTAQADDVLVLPTGEHLNLNRYPTTAALQEISDHPWADYIDAVCEHVVECS